MIADGIFSNIRQLCTILCEEVQLRFPSFDSSSVLGGFVFLRYICPALVSPEAHLQNTGTLTNELRRGLILSSKIIQNIANRAEFGAKEAYMGGLNEFVTQSTPAVNNFLRSLLVRI